MSKHQVILYPTDFSTNATLAFQLASSLARDHDAQLVALHVVQPPTQFVGLEIDHSEAKEKLHDLEQQQTKMRIKTLVVDGDPVTEILRVAEELSCSLIVMGTHGRTGLSRLLMGSVAEQIVRKACCPVLTVKEPAATPQAKPKGQLAAAEAAR